MKVCIKLNRYVIEVWKLVKEYLGINFGKIVGGTTITGLRGPRHAISYDY